MNKVFIVAEIGCNHNGNIDIAKKLIYEAKKAGADAVKFQSFVPKELVAKSASKANYQKENDGEGTQLEMLNKLALTQDEYLELVRYAKELDICIFSTAFDMESLEFLQSIGQNIWKIPSGEITNLPLLEKISQIKCENKKIILSTGMSTIPEIKFAMNILNNSIDTRFTVLHCNTQYPTLPDDMNLRAVEDLRSISDNWSVGLSDHSEGIVASLVSVGIGISFLEKHFTLDKNMPGPDHKASITPDELKLLCDNVRVAEKMLGSNKKHVTQSEKSNKFIARKSIVAKNDIAKGEIFSTDNLTCKRPGNGISPIKWYDVLGKKAYRDFKADELIECEGVKWEDE